MKILFDKIQSILSTDIILHSIAVAGLIIGGLTITYVLYSVASSYFIAKKTGKPISWLKVTDDIRWTLYDWNERDQEYVMSLPRLIYFISSILIVYVVLADKPSMLSPLLGFNLSSMVSYTGKKYIEERNNSKFLSKVLDPTNIVDTFNDIKDKLNGKRYDTYDSEDYDTGDSSRVNLGAKKAILEEDNEEGS